MSKVIGLITTICILAAVKAIPTKSLDMLAQNITTTTRIENYLLQNQRQYFGNIKTMAADLEDFKKNYDDRLQILLLNREFLEFKLNEAEQRLIPLELLDDVHNYCVHKYRPKLPEITAINISLAACLETARDEYQAIVQDPFLTLNKLEMFYGNETVVALQHCKMAYQKLDKNYTECVTSVIKQSNEVSTVNINLFYNQLKNSEYVAILKMKNTFDCHAFVVFNTLTILGEVTGLIDSCTAGTEFCSSCSEDMYISADRCPYHMSMPLTDDFRLSEKVNNPFRGLTLGTPCLQINFINNKNITLTIS